MTRNGHAIILLIGALLTGCVSFGGNTIEIFTTQDGEVIACESYSQSPCGMQLSGCGKQRDVSFNCVKHVFYDSPNSLETQDEIDNLLNEWGDHEVTD